ncbi:hypothetical protein MWU49_03900 [Alcanivorax sp. S6407]|uniref:hypothetical protein n=1 Tax=Alcanivorax sp. S6407 TaxID=2926424 RepID=UPI001FF5F3D8|nr:hypothetical protein [Alcanivorax sp. S6407]MCK0152834.1 hypothetical protein [Alcanivorax sp. S6407]
MLKLSITDSNKYILWVPYLYTFYSRTNSVRDFVVNAATSWVPAFILILVLSGLSFLDSIVFFISGYVLFLCVYEIGYVANDSYGLIHDETPRDRLGVSPTKGFLSGFVIVRLFVFLLLSLKLNILHDYVFVTAYSALILLLVAHNTLRRVEIKFFTFFQLSLFRYSLPVVPALVVESELPSVELVFLLAAATFTLPRFITYLDAKGRLDLPERKLQGFLMKAYCAVTPIVIYLAVLHQSLAPVLVLIWLLFVQFVYRLAAPKW